ncbi:hypothetical protein GALMADRAFT_16745, partial [Galerina marginata CBS 339.88]
MIFLGYRGHHSNMIFMRSPRNVIFTSATALFDEKLFPKCAKDKVPPVTKIQKPIPEEPEIEIEIGSDPEEDDPYNPPQIPFIPPRGNEEPHDGEGPQSPPQSPPGSPPGGGPRRSDRPRKDTKKDGNVYPPGTSTDTDRRRRLPATGKPISAPNSGRTADELDTHSERDLDIAKLAAEGGVSWYNYLLSKAIPHNDFPDPMNVRDWTSRDIGKLPADDQKAWREAQQQELEALKK